MSKQKITLGKFDNLVTGANGQYTVDSKDNLQDCVNFIPESSGALRSRPGIKKMLPLVLQKNDKAAFFSYKGKDYAVIYDTLLKCNYFHEPTLSFELKDPGIGASETSTTVLDDDNIVGLRGRTREKFGNVNFFKKQNGPYADSDDYSVYVSTLIDAEINYYNTVLPYAQGPVNANSNNSSGEDFTIGSDLTDQFRNGEFRTNTTPLANPNALSIFLRSLRAYVYDLHSSMWWQRIYLYNITDDKIETYRVIRPGRTQEDSGHEVTHSFDRENSGTTLYGATRQQTPHSTAIEYGTLPAIGSLDRIVSPASRNVRFGGSDLEYDVAVGADGIMLTDKTGTIPSLYLDMNERQAFVDVRCLYFGSHIEELDYPSGEDRNTPVEFKQEICVFNSFLTLEEFAKRPINSRVGELANKNFKNAKSSPYTFFDTYDKLIETDESTLKRYAQGTTIEFGQFTEGPNAFYGGTQDIFINPLSENASFLVSRLANQSKFDLFVDRIQNVNSRGPDQEGLISMCKVRSINGEPWYEVKQYTVQEGPNGNGDNVYLFGFSDPYFYAADSATDKDTINSLLPQWLFPMVKISVDANGVYRGYITEYTDVSVTVSDYITLADIQLTLRQFINIGSGSVIPSTFTFPFNFAARTGYTEHLVTELVGGGNGNYFKSAAFFGGKSVLVNSIEKFNNAFIASKTADPLEFSGIVRNASTSGAESLLTEGFIQRLTPEGGLVINSVDNTDNTLYFGTSRGEISAERLDPGGLDLLTINNIAVSDIPRQRMFGMVFVVPPDKFDIFLLETLRDYSRVQYSSMLKHLRGDALRDKKIDKFVTSLLEGNGIFIIDGTAYFVYISQDQKFLFSRLDFKGERVINAAYFESGDAVVHTESNIYIFNPFGAEPLEDGSELSLTLMHPSQYRRTVEKDAVSSIKPPYDITAFSDIRLFGDVNGDITTGSVKKGVAGTKTNNEDYASLSGCRLDGLKDGLKISFSSRKVDVSSIEFAIEGGG